MSFWGAPERKAALSFRNSYSGLSSQTMGEDSTREQEWLRDSKKPE